MLFLLEFVGDKIPVFDLLWNAAHTFVRVPVAAYLAYAATSQLPQWEQIAATFAGGLIALAAHGGKTAARAADRAFARALLEFRAKHNRRRTGGISDVDRHAPSVHSYR